MKSKTKALLSIALCFILCGTFCIFSSALSTNEYGLGLSVDCEESADTADLSITLTNSNSFDVDDISVSFDVPDGLEAVLAPVNGEDYGFEIGTLKAGASHKEGIIFGTVSSSDLITIGAGEYEPESSPDITVIIVAVIAAVVAVAAIIIFAVKHKKAAAMMLALAILIPFAGTFGVHAIGTNETRSFTLDDTITVSGQEYPFSVTVTYSANTANSNYFELETNDDKADTVTRPTVSFNGTTVADSTVTSVTYEVFSGADNFKSGSVGEAVLDGCLWSIDSLALKSGENKIVFTATLDNGETLTQTQVLNYDRGEIYRRTQSEEAEEGRTKYVKNIINIYFDIDTTDERIAEILDEIGAERVGESNDIVMVQARVEAENLDALNKKCEEIEKYDEVIGADIEQILPLEINVTTNDPWSTYKNNKETINEDIPGGYNWHAEAVQAYSTWKYDSYFSKATVGIIDGPVMTNHEDLGSTVKFTDSYAADNVLSTVPKTLAGQFHGTHVSSIIGATPNNGIGVSGMLWDVDIYAANYSVASNAISYIVDAVSSHVTNGAKTINLSIGLNPSASASTTYNPYTDPYTTSELDSTANQCAIGMYNLLQAGKEFVVVQSAGNGVIDTRLGTNVYRSVDATQNGLYCSIRKNTKYGKLSTAQVNEVYNRVIVVGAASNQSNNSNGLLFEMAPFSNAGDRVDIYAPGYQIMGAVTPQANASGNYNIYYGMASGTSQAAPIVTATAAMCFAINPALTGAQVKSLICAEENTRCTVYDYSNMQKGSDGKSYDLHPIEGDGRMLSMKLVAEAALRTVCGKANYTYLNRIVAAAQSLNPNDYTNYEIVQAVLDSIDYNLYEYQQDEVTAKANELVAAMDKLIEKTPADYSAVEEAKAQATALDPNDFVDFSAVTEAINAVIYGKYSDEQDAVNKMAQNILDAIASLVPKSEIASIDSNIVADNSNMCIVLTTEYIESLTDSLTASGGYEVTFTPNSNGTYSTGSTVTLTKDGYDDVTYVVAILGDIDGNGTSDANDAFLTEMYAIGLLQPSHNVYKIAADANCDGAITRDDSLLIQNSAIYNDFIFNDYTAGA